MARRFVVIGGGFYGICIALYLRSLSSNVVLLERENDLFTKASYANQARVHAGFHYPRSFATAKRSTILNRRFISDFGPAIHSGFRMLYAIARRQSKTSPQRFLQMFQQLGAEIRPATAAERTLFNPDMIENVFACAEVAFDARKLSDMMAEQLAKAKIGVRTGAEVTEVARDRAGGLTVRLVGGETVTGDIVFNATYARLNHITLPDPPERLPIKNELTEIVLVEPGPEIAGLAVTVMDGPFFSLMPFPAEDCYSLTHVRYTPQTAWQYGDGPMPSEVTLVTPRSRWLHMVRDSAQYMPALADIRRKGSLFVTKAVLKKNEIDDGRPIFVHAHRALPGFYSVLGGKIDNIYDLFSVLPDISSDFKGANPDWVFRRGQG